MAFGRRIAITSHDVVTRALHVTRSEDFGDMSWSEPLEVLCRSLDREARLTHAGRRLARDLLVDVLVARHRTIALAGTANATAAAPTERRAVGALDGAVAVRAAAAVGGTDPDDPRWADITFASLAFEERWHVPTYAEWLGGADLGELVASTLAVVEPPVVAGTVLLEQGPALAAHGVRLETLPGELQAAIDATTARSVALRRATSDGVDPDKVARYWAWRLGLVDQRARSGA